MVRAAIIKEARHQKQADATGARPGSFRAGQQRDDRRIGIGAKPFFAVEPEMLAFGHRASGEAAHIGAAFLFRHELRALGQFAHIGLRQPVEILGLKRRIAIARQQHRRAIGDIDRAAQAKLGLVEQIGEGVFSRGGISLRPAENALAMRHRMDAECAERGLFQLAVSRVVFDVLDVAAEFVAVVQNRRMAVADARAFIQPSTGHFAETVKMRVDMGHQIGRQIQRQQITQRRVVAIEILAGGIGGNRGHCRRFLMR